MEARSSVFCPSIPHILVQYMTYDDIVISVMHVVGRIIKSFAEMMALHFKLFLHQ